MKINTDRLDHARHRLAPVISRGRWPFDTAQSLQWLFLLLLPIVVRLPFNVLGGGLTILEPITAAICLVWLISILGKKRRVVIHRWPLGLLGVFYAACVVSLIATPQLLTSIVELLTYVNGGIILCMILQLIRTRAQLRMAINVLLVGSAIPLFVSAMGIVAMLSEFRLPAFLGRQWKLQATFLSANQLPTYTILILPLLLHFMLDRTKDVRIRFIAGMGAAIAYAATVASGSRSGLVGATVCALGYALWRGRRRSRTAIAIALVLAIGGLFAFSSFQTHLPKAIQKSVYGAVRFFSGEMTWKDMGGGRRDQFEALSVAVRRAPIIGIGVGAFGAQMDGLLDRDAKDQQFHNLFLSLLAETGGVGLITFLAFLAFALRQGIRWMRVRYGSDRFLIGAMVFGLLGNLLHQQFHFGLRQHVFWVGVGLILATASVYAREDTRVQEVVGGSK